jgi:3',5'-cyclic AMP phosphodiesterase CpdA
VRTIVHLSDLHFGRLDPELPPALQRAVVEAAPDLVVVSGDLTQRARVAEFKAAARFLEGLPAPQLTVPDFDVNRARALASSVEWYFGPG